LWEHREIWGSTLNFFIMQIANVQIFSFIRGKVRPIRLEFGRIANRVLKGDRANYPTWNAVSDANRQTIEFIKGTQCRCIAEIGILEGHTSLEFAKFLNGEGELHLFDYEDRVKMVSTALDQAGFRNVRAFGSSYKLLDSYNWSLAKLLETKEEAIYDYVFLDGAHNWAVDALTAFLADRLLKVQGYLDFDDYHWTLGGSPSLNPSVFPLTGKLYTPDQISTQQVKMVVDLIVKRDPRYKEVVVNKIYQKIA
jgi:predicted O-methyltransferase YrrM